jgi:hypothetical protein
MSQVRCSPTGSIKGFRLIAGALMAVSALAVGLLGPARASADGNVNNCSYVTVNVVCVGQVNTMPVTVNIGDVASGNDLSPLTNNLNNAVVSVANISDINILSADLTTVVQTAVNTWVATITNTTTKTCSVVVVPPPTPTQPISFTVSCS